MGIFTSYLNDQIITSHFSPYTREYGVRKGCTLPAFDPDSMLGSYLTSLSIAFSSVRQRYLQYLLQSVFWCLNEQCTQSIKPNAGTQNTPLLIMVTATITINNDLFWPTLTSKAQNSQGLLDLSFSFLLCVFHSKTLISPMMSTANHLGVTA